MSELIITEYLQPDGESKYIGSDGFEYTHLGSLNGLFSKGGFFDKVVKTASGIFKKEDGTKTFIGDTITTAANSFGEKMGSAVANPGSVNNGTFTPLTQPLTQPGTLPPNTGKSPFYAGENSVVSPGWLLAGVALIVGAGFGLNALVSKKK